jgi:hypothetical protein
MTETEALLSEARLKEFDLSLFARDYPSVPALWEKAPNPAWMMRMLAEAAYPDESRIRPLMAEAMIRVMHLAPDPRVALAVERAIGFANGTVSETLLFNAHCGARAASHEARRDGDPIRQRVALAAQLTAYHRAEEGCTRRNLCDVAAEAIAIAIDARLATDARAQRIHLELSQGIRRSLGNPFADHPALRFRGASKSQAIRKFAARRGMGYFLTPERGLWWATLQNEHGHALSHSHLMAMSAAHLLFEDAARFHPEIYHALPDRKRMPQEAR